MSDYRLFKPTYNDRQGNKCEVSCWAVEFRDHTPRRKPLRLKLFSDRVASDAAARHIISLVALRLGGVAPSAEHVRWLSQTEPRIAEQLAKWGIIDSVRVSATKSLVDHLSDWHDALLDKGTSKKTADNAHFRAVRVLIGPPSKTIKGRKKRTIPGLKLSAYGEIQPNPVQAKLAELRKSGELSAQTSNYYLGALNQFCVWMLRNGRAAENPLNCLSKLPDKVVKAEPKHARRIISPAEMAKVLAAAESGPEIQGMSGHERSLIYRLAFETGLRQNEIRDLTAGSFCFAEKSGFVRCIQGSAKNGKDAEIPLLPNSIEPLRVHLKDKLPRAKAFNLPESWDILEAWQRDLKAAGIEYKDLADQFFDFHSLRHCTASWLADQGVHPLVVKDIMRHADLKTTLKYFKVSVREKLAEGLAAFPVVKSSPDQVSLEKKGKKEA